MLLAIDVGNTNICFALFEKSVKKASWRVTTLNPQTSDEWAVWLTQVMAIKGLKLLDISAVMMSSVVPPVTGNLRSWCKGYIKAPLYILGEDGIETVNKALIDRPSEVGTDLMLNAWAGHTLYQGPLLVVDFGTATTISKVDDQGNFCGVIIAPGIKVSLKALYEAAAKLPNIEIACPAKVIGTHTIESMQSGIFWGYISMIEGLVKRAQEEIGFLQKLKVISTGGFGSLIKDHTKIIDHYDEDLTLKGLQIMYTQLEEKRKNEQKTKS